MRYDLVIPRLRPHLEEYADYAVVDYSDGEKARLEWRSEEPMPTLKEMEAAWFKVSRRQKRAEMESHMISESEAEIPSIWLAVALDQGDTRIQALKARGRKLMAKYRQIEAARTIEDIEAVFWEEGGYY